jgi:hypothetical protein
VDDEHPGEAHQLLLRVSAALGREHRRDLTGQRCRPIPDQPDLEALGLAVLQQLLGDRHTFRKPSDASSFLFNILLPS